MYTTFNKHEAFYNRPLKLCRGDGNRLLQLHEMANRIFKEFEEKETVPSNYLDIFCGCQYKHLMVEDHKDMMEEIWCD
jgi:hypothetical protein